MSNAELLKRLERPVGPVDAVLDTDAYNEVDDQFAIAYLLHAPEKVTVRGLFAAPFYAAFNPHSTDPEDGMVRSYEEILRLLNLMHREEVPVFRGATRFLPDERTPVSSDAARRLVELAEDYTPDNPLYVLSIGAITNVASALLMKPEIRDCIVIVWLGGHAPHWPDTFEFNMLQDVAAARVVMDSSAALIQLPCNGVVDALKTSGPELRAWLGGKNLLCDFLVSRVVEEAESYAAGQPWSRVLWDISAVAWLIGDARMVEDRLVPAPIPQYDLHYSHDPRRQLIRQAWRVDRDRIYADLFQRLTGGSHGHP